MGRGGAALGEGAHLGGDDGEARGPVRRPGGLDGRVKGQDVGLEGDAVDDADDVEDFLRTGGISSMVATTRRTISPPWLATVLIGWSGRWPETLSALRLTVAVSAAIEVVVWCGAVACSSVPGRQILVAGGDLAAPLAIESAGGLDLGHDLPQLRRWR